MKEQKDMFIEAIHLASSNLKIPVPEIEFGLSEIIFQTAIKPRSKPISIFVNTDWIIKANKINIYLAAFHEMRHYFQLLLVLMNDQELLNNGFSIEEIKEISIWRDEFTSYSSDKDDFIKYVRQKIELDAQRYAMNLYIQIFGSIDT